MLDTFKVFANQIDASYRELAKHELFVVESPRSPSSRSSPIRVGRLSNSRSRSSSMSSA